MSYYGYRRAREIERPDPPFEALIMAAYARADTHNAELIRACWPHIAAERQARYDTPGGYLATDPNLPEPIAAYFAAHANDVTDQEN